MLETQASRTPLPKIALPHRALPTIEQDLDAIGRPAENWDH